MPVLFSSMFSPVIREVRQSKEKLGITSQPENVANFAIRFAKNLHFRKRGKVESGKRVLCCFSDALLSPLGICGIQPRPKDLKMSFNGVICFGQRPFPREANAVNLLG
jgi:hypothetical protein